MDKQTFRKKLIKHIDSKLDDEDLEDDLLFSDYWSEIRDSVDSAADDEDIEEHADDTEAEE